MELHDIEQEEIRPLKFNYLFHFFLFVLIFILHLIIYSKVYWISEIFEKFFIILSFLIIIYFLFPIIPLIMIFLKRFKLKIIHIFKKLSFLFLIIFNITYESHSTPLINFMFFNHIYFNWNINNCSHIHKYIEFKTFLPRMSI